MTPCTWFFTFKCMNIFISFYIFFIFLHYRFKWTSIQYVTSKYFGCFTQVSLFNSNVRSYTYSWLCFMRYFLIYIFYYTVHDNLMGVAGLLLINFSKWMHKWQILNSLIFYCMCDSNRYPYIYTKKTQVEGYWVS